MKPIHTLYISYDGMTDPLGQSQVIPYLQGLSKLGYCIHLLSFEKNERLASARTTIQELLDQSHIDWIPCVYTRRPPVLSTLWDIFVMRRVARQIVAAHDVRLVHCRSYISSLVGVAVKREFGIKCVFDMRGFWADERVEGGVWNKSNPVYRLIYTYFKKKELQFLNESDCTISLTYAAAAVIQSWQRVKPDIVIKVIPCCADLAHFDNTTVSAAQHEAFRAELDIPPQSVVLTYLGSVGTWYMLDEMLDFFSVFLTYYPGSIFLFVTTDNAQEIFAKAQSRGVDQRFVRVRKASRSELPAILSLSTASIFFIIPTFSKMASSPTKMGELMGMGIPIICNTGVGDIARIMDDARAGIALEAFNTSAYQQACQQFDRIRALPAHHIKKGAATWYSLEEGVKRYAEVYRKLLHQTANSI